MINKYFEKKKKKTGINIGSQLKGKILAMWRSSLEGINFMVDHNLYPRNGNTIDDSNKSVIWGNRGLSTLQSQERSP